MSYFFCLLQHFKPVINSLFCWRNIQNVTPPPKRQPLRKGDNLGSKANGLRGPPRERNRDIGQKIKNWSSREALPGRKGGGGYMLPVWILKRLVLVFINVCRLLSALPWLSQFGRGRLSLDCLQSAFSLKIRLVLISSSAIPNHDVITGARGLGFAWSNLAKKTRDCSQSRSSLVAISFHVLLLLFGPCRFVRDATLCVYLKFFGSLYTRA